MLFIVFIVLEDVASLLNQRKFIILNNHKAKMYMKLLRSLIQGLPLDVTVVEVKDFFLTSILCHFISIATRIIRIFVLEASSVRKGMQKIAQISMNPSSLKLLKINSP